MASSPTSIENQIDSFLEQFKRTASRAMEETHRISYNASSSISRSRSGNLDLEILEAEDVESMTGEIENGDLAVRDVADLLQQQYAIITGGKTREGCPIITFPDNGNFHNLTDLDYQRLMLYLTSVPTLQEADLGFHLIIDRRNDKWNSVKTVLLKISAFFPGLVHVAYVLRPTGFLQKTISEVSNKLFRDEFKFRVIVLANVSELYDFVEKDQLTEQLGGDLPYCHHTWIQNRISLEKFSSMTQDVSMALDSFTRRLAEVEFPNNTIATTTLLSQQQAEYNELKEEILSAARHGEALLDSVRQLAGKGTADRLGNVAAVERLLVQLEETERTFDLFWSHHSSRLRHCLALRQFEQDFRELQASLDQHLKTVEDMTEVGETQARVDQLLRDTSAFQRICRGDIDRAEEVITAGQQLLSGRHQCPAEVVEPKCAELQRVCTILSQRLERRLHTLTKCRELMERIDKANTWCTRGIELLASQNSTTPADQALQELQQLIEAAEEFHHPRCIFQDSITPETKALVTQVLQRIEDVSLMCDKRIAALKQQLVKPARPIQTVTPEPAKPIQPAPQTVKPGRILKKANTMPKMEMGPIEGEISSPEGEARDVEVLRLKRGHVLAELVETERIYVAELGSIIKGYKMELANEAMAHLIPSPLVGKADVLFGNLEEIYVFHGETFLRDLENCITNTELVALCFVQRRKMFFRLYSYYCQNIPRSERLREQIQSEPQFLTTCQQKLGHKLPLAAYLLKPVQRITKYQLLLKDLLKYSDEPLCCTELHEALDCMLVVLKCVNDSMHQTAITGFGGDLGAQGELLLQGSFSVWSSSKRERRLRLKPSQRHIFLYEKALIFCKHSKPQAHNKATYHFKRYLKMSQIGLTESVKGDARRFEIWLQGRAEVHTIQAPSIDVKQSWVQQIKGVLMSQLAELKGKQNTALGQSNHKYVSSTVYCPYEVTEWVLFRPLRQTISWEAQSSVSGSLRTLSVDGSSVISHITDVSQSTEEDVAWSSENSNSDDEDTFGENPGPAPGGRFVALADYCAVGQSEVTMREGDNLELLKVGCAGWWFVKLIGSNVEGWAPAAYLEPISRKTSRSSQSVNSQEAM
ncbi:guanine nucleotide exchange factor DBS isoform X2 [Cephus cinctus]|uniref:Guanine nucleotide exchange factor DBS isoform X2 n=1 Tax=Cephus cinctus TaxID=211228 RepID=A0AAJ7BXV5_CEPCN|nr:guanine nucleotide exchange factor DBS isoform X2 [Cephus cinctus]